MRLKMKVFNSVEPYTQYALFIKIINFYLVLYQKNNTLSVTRF